MMKKITLIFILSLFLNNSYSQGIDILSAEQFCSGTTELTFPNNYGGSDLTEVGCLGSIPNASYFFMEIDNPGNLIFTISQETTPGGVPIDVDFIAWGPFVDINDANASISYTDCPTCPNNTTDPTFYPYAPDQITDCSFDIAPTETMTITGALQGEIYVVLITNFNGAQGNITFQQTGGIGTTTCNAPICGGNFYDTGGIGGNYSNNETETTTIYPYFTGGTVTVDFSSFSVAPGDILNVYNGPDATYDLIGTVTGAPSSFSSTTASTTPNPSGAITFVFNSNTSSVSNGWESDITCSPPPTPVSCGTQFTDSGGAAGDYSAYETQTSTFYPTNTGDVITVTFTSFDTENNYDELTVHNGPDTTYPIIGIYSGAGIPGPIQSSDPSGALTFVFNSDSSFQYSGWTADITCSPYITPTICGSTFFDSGGASTDYSSNELITTTLLPDIPGTAVMTTFTSFNTETDYDTLSVYDGPDATYPLLGTFSGTAIPGPFTSSDPSGALTFVFDSDGSLQYTGWAADITCVTNTPSCGETFYDSGGAGGDYSNNENETTIISPTNSGDTVTTTFTVFNLATGDTLEIFDGATSLGVFTGTTIPGPFTATNPSGELTFTFTSNGTGTQSGWAADITCSVLCNLIITDTVFPIGADSCNLDYTTLTTNAIGTTLPSNILSESFDNASLPTGWAINNGSGDGSWSITNSSNAGGTPREATLSGGYNSSASGTRTLTSPAINITGATNLQLDFKQYLWHYSSAYNYSISIQTNTDNAGWVNQYTVNNVNNDIATETRTIDLSAISGNSLRFRYRLNGNPFGLFYWYIDDIQLTADSTTTPPQITWSPNTELYTDSTLTTPYSGGYSETVYAAPSGTQTYTATDQNGCTNTVTITNNKKTWMGYIDNNWYIDGNWEPNGVPTSSDCVLIPDVAVSNFDEPIADIINLIPLPPLPAYALNLTVAPTANLEIAPETTLVVTDWIALEGTIDIRDSGSLIQITDGATNVNNNTGSGNINMQRTATISSTYDYVYWASPVEGFNVSQVSPGSSLIYEWIPTIAGNGIGNYGNWQATSENMINGKGYIIRNVIGTPTPSTPEFVGKPNNGVITKAITRGTYNVASPGGDYTGGGTTIATRLDDNWNLVGNPYPSAISADTFIAVNASSITDDTDSSISGTIYLWRHLNTPSNAVNDPFYDGFVYNYNPNDYIAYNSTGSNPSGFGGGIAAGQAFFVLMEHTAPINSNVTFNNTMRNETLDNSQFYRTNETSQQTSNIEKHRIWLDLISPNNNANSTLVGYVEGATNAQDRLFDGFELSENNTRFYSLINDNEFAIQGKALPFHDTDTVPLGIEIPQNGNYTIAINNLDGLFETTNQPIFIEDTYTNNIHNLRVNPYSFNITAGTYNDRFILRYTEPSLSINDYEYSGLEIAAPNNSFIKVKSETSTIKTVVVYDLLGRALINKTEINASEISFNNHNFAEGTYIVKAILANAKQKIQKVVLKL
ncbi:T9SS type A sorting domain-containing protein [Lacinutrix sp. C3R15]|uniref:CUB domain-containing protein n=1 Tax=Flavobacteriaceae TaxID=49546 RepID=UPI001C08148D|nr:MULTISPECIES: CUB domain-containing protein [Flavobacteriaceae]MBU2939714.1 T9SS type A sorting domain-containing protein [Lacinutrix sp. C3R15]MDO6623029.1 T9SS type A sorting domain-containing protein [Oceanihabitans sp. 1_MG-2023]